MTSQALQGLARARLIYCGGPCKAWCLYAEAGDAKEPYKYVYKQQDDPFSFEIIRPGNQHSSEPIWNTTGTRLIYKEQYLEITSWAARGSTMYGLGERISTSGERPHAPVLHLSVHSLRSGH